MISMPARFYDCKMSDLRLNISEVYLTMGYGDSTPPDEICGLVDEMVSELDACCTPRCGYTIVQGAQAGKEAIKVGEITFSPGAIITSAMRGVDHYAFFTATAGQGFEEWFAKLKQEDDILKLFIADALGSVTADAVVEFMIGKLETEMAARGWRITNNYSPGYCDWSLKDQPLLFSLFPEGATGIRLTDSCLMLPVKSVSGIIGVGPDARKRAYGCDICNMTNCIKNRKKASPTENRH